MNGAPSPRTRASILHGGSPGKQSRRDFKRIYVANGYMRNVPELVDFTLTEKSIVLDVPFDNIKYYNNFIFLV